MHKWEAMVAADKGHGPRKAVVFEENIQQGRRAPRLLRPQAFDNAGQNALEDFISRPRDLSRFESFRRSLNPVILPCICASEVPFHSNSSQCRTVSNVLTCGLMS